jgi:ketosteroid isomerase-like protein
MSRKNVELAQAALNAFVELDEGLIDLQQMDEFFAQDAITTFSGFGGFVDEQTTLHGADEFLKLRATWMEPYDDFIYEPVRIIDAEGNRVAVTLHQRGKPHGSDSWAEMDYGLVYTVEEGVIIRADFYATPERALEAAGLGEQAISQENVALVRRNVEAWNRRDLAAWMASFRWDAEIDWSRSRAPFKGVYRGRDGIETFWAEFWSTFRDVQIEVHSFTEAGSEVVVSNTAHMRGREGIEVVARSALVNTVERGQITRLRMFQDQAEALEALGLSE